MFIFNNKYKLYIKNWCITKNLEFQKLDKTDDYKIVYNLLTKSTIYNTTNIKILYYYYNYFIDTSLYIKYLKLAIDYNDVNAIILIDKYYLKKYNNNLPNEILSELSSYYNNYLVNRQLCSANIFNYCLTLHNQKINVLRILVILCKYRSQEAYKKLLCQNYILTLSQLEIPIKTNLDLKIIGQHILAFPHVNSTLH